MRIERTLGFILKGNDIFTLEMMLYLMWTLHFWKSKGSQLDSDEEVQNSPKNVEPKPKEPISINEPPHEDYIYHEPIETTKFLVFETRKRPV